MIERYVRQEAAALRGALEALATLPPMDGGETRGEAARLAWLARVAVLGKEIWRAASVLEQYEQMHADGAAPESAVACPGHRCG